MWANTADYESHGRSDFASLIDRFTDAQIAGSPTLCLALATNHLSRGEGDKVEHWTAVATRSLENVPQSERGALAVGAALIQASGAARDGVARMGKDAVRAYGLLPEDSPWRSPAAARGPRPRWAIVSRPRALEEGCRRQRGGPDVRRYARALVAGDRRRRPRRGFDPPCRPRPKQIAMGSTTAVCTLASRFGSGPRPSRPDRGCRRRQH
jgi:hypothetical protein